MAPILNVPNENDYSTLIRVADTLDIKYNLSDKNKSKSLDGFEYIPSLKLYVAKEKTNLGDSWFESHKKLQANGERMLTPLEFIGFLKYARTNLPKTYNEITELRSPWRAEWINAEFKTKGNKFYLNYYSFDGNGKIIQKSEILDRDTLMKDKQISLKDYLDNNHTSQGLPSKKVKSGDLSYFYPGSERNNNSIARFYADSNRAFLNCYRYPSNWVSVLGVRAVRHA